MGLIFSALDRMKEISMNTMSFVYHGIILRIINFFRQGIKVIYKYLENASNRTRHYLTLLLIKIKSLITWLLGKL